MLELKCQPFNIKYSTVWRDCSGILSMPRSIDPHKCGHCCTVIVHHSPSLCVCVVQVAIVTPHLSAFQTEDGVLMQEQEHQVGGTPHPVTLLATSNGTHIAVQVKHPEAT